MSSALGATDGGFGWTQQLGRVHPAERYPDSLGCRACTATTQGKAQNRPLADRSGLSQGTHKGFCNRC